MHAISVNRRKTMSNAKSKVRQIQDNLSSLGGDKKGALVYWWLRGAKSPVDFVKKLFEKHGLSWNKWGIPEIKTSAAYRKAINEVGRTLKNGSSTTYLIRPIDSDDRYIVHGIVHEKRYKKTHDLSHSTDCKIKLDKATGQITLSAEHEIGQRIKDEYNDLLNMMIVNDFSRMLTRDLDKMSAVSIRPTGAIYYVPEMFRDELTRLRDILEDVPGDSHLCVIDIYGKQSDLKRDCKIALQEELKSLQEEIEKFKTKPPRRDSLEHRLELFKTLKKKAKLYADMLDLKVKDINQGVKDCNDMVKGMIDGGQWIGSQHPEKREYRIKHKQAKRLRKVVSKKQRKAHVN
jgi:hypothetical protein